MIILGLNVYHGDSSACIALDGKLIAAAEEEVFTDFRSRFTRLYCGGLVRR